MSDYWQYRYVPKTNAEEWASRASRIGELYAELKPIMRDIEKQHPDVARHIPNDIDASDGFFRLEDLVVNVRNIVVDLSERPRAQFPQSLRTKYAPKTEPIIAEVKAMLQNYIKGEENFEARRNARRIADDLQWALHETYQAAETMQGRQSQAR